MGVTRQYLKFRANSSFGLIGSAKGGLISIPNQKNLVAAAAAENVIVWNLKTGEKFLNLSSESKHEVSCIAVTPSGETLAVGYEDGSLKLFDLEHGDCYVTLNGHKSGITSLAFDAQGHRLASGARDTCLIVWDVVNECGLYRLKGHKGPITRVMFMKSRPNILVSSSKDTFVKFWDLTCQHCFKTLSGHVTEVWDFALLKEDSYLVTGSADSELRVWKLIFRSLESTDATTGIEPNMKKLKVEEDKESSDEEDDEFDAGHLKIERLGSVLRQSQDKVAHIMVDPTGRLLCCHSSDNSIENFLICSEAEVKKRLQKKAKKERRKLSKGEGDEPAAGIPITESTIQEDFRRLKVIKSGGKVRHIDLLVNNDCANFFILTGNNLIEQFRLLLDDKEAEPEKTRSFDHAGHRSDVRSVAFSSDNTAIVSVSHESMKVWNRASLSCIRSIPSGYGLCCLFVPGDRQIVVGTKKGSLQIFDLGSATMTEEVEDAHSKEIWSIHLMPDKRGFVTASADQTVKFWQFELIRFEGAAETEGKRLSVVHLRTLQLEEDALAVRVSADGRLIAISLLDSTVKVFFVDTLKFFMSLYGHKLPAVAIDISSDSTLIATGSADKNVKIWGLDFGDCHKSIFAHDDTITCLQFIPNTHMFFTAGKDGKIKQWDADNFERIITLDGHHHEIWGMSVSPNGKFVISAGHDKTLRLWERTQEPLVLEDQRETEREEEGDNQLATGDSRVIPGEQDKEVGLPSKKTAETERSAERLMEAIEVYTNYNEELTSHNEECRRTKKTLPPPPLPLLMTVYDRNVESPEDYMAQVISKIRSSELEETLLVLPLDVVTSLIEIMETLLNRGLACEVVCRTFFFLIEIHFGPLTSSSHLKSLVLRVRDLAAKRLQELKDTVGFNLAALRFIQQQEEDKEKVQSFLEATSKFREKRKKKKQKERAMHTAIIAL